MTKQPPREIELKLALPPGEAAAFLARMARRRTQPVCQTLHTRYFDTPDFDLSRAGVALRVRRAGRRWVQTLKTEGERLGGLSQRTEYEMPVARGEPDWSRFPDEALAHVPASLRARLVPVFETRFARTAWLLAGRGGAQIEVALDRGEVRAGPRRAPLCELELELKQGQPDALFELARTWAAAFGCVPNDESKAARGVRLAHGGAPAPVRSGALALDPGQSMEDAFGAICRDALAHFQANLPGVLASDDIEFVHQARVALRRLRAILRVSRRACVPPPALLDGLRAIAAALGPTRDWDVLCGETWPAIMQHFDDAPAGAAETARLQAHRTAVRDAMRAALRRLRAIPRVPRRACVPPPALLDGLRAIA
ncbi:MAG: inorganic triphosphatase, partial [Thiobacillus sp.]|nr:inorganic triphosphatase [Thiobacillus sp.]